MKTENNLQNQINKTDETKTTINANTIIESSVVFLQKYGRIVFLSLVALIVIIAAVLAYFAWSEGADKEYNTKLEQGIAAYLNATYAQDKQQFDTAVATANESFRDVMANAKSTHLKLRAEYELASILFDSRSYLDAARAYDNVSKNKSFYLAEPALYNKGIAELEQKKYDESILTLETFIKLYPKSYLTADATIALANVMYVGKSQNAQAIALLKNWAANNAEETTYMPTVEETISLMENGIY